MLSLIKFFLLVKKKKKKIETVNILLRASITMINKRGDRGSPCLSPRELLKKPDGVPLTKIEKRAEEIQCAIH
jgi:hypothetical protein